MNNHDRGDQMLRFLARISGTRYDEDATRDAGSPGSSTATSRTAKRDLRTDTGPREGV